LRRPRRSASRLLSRTRACSTTERHGGELRRPL
jgi:hypothetical protein